VGIDWLGRAAGLEMNSGGRLEAGTHRVGCEAEHRPAGPAGTGWGRRPPRAAAEPAVPAPEALLSGMSARRHAQLSPGPFGVQHPAPWVSQLLGRVLPLGDPGPKNHKQE